MKQQPQNKLDPKDYIQKLEVQNKEYKRRISWKDADIVQKRRTIAKLQEFLALEKEKSVTLEQEKTLLQNSRSFKLGKIITAPLRLGRAILASPKKGLLTQQPAEKSDLQQKTVSYSPGVINLGGQLLTFFGKHRSGWGYAVYNLAPLNHHNGIYLDTFIEKSFAWQPENVQAIRKPWIGFIHVPPNIPHWIGSEQSNDAIFATEAWKESIPHCKGLFTLSEYHKRDLETKIDVPVNALLHPTEQPENKWEFEKFENNSERKIVQVGWWLRKLHAIYELPESDYKKIFLNVGSDSNFQTFFNKERELRKAEGLFKDEMYDTVTMVDYLPDEMYDKLLSENIMFADLYDSSANNLVIECIVRNTPLLINPIEPVVEYLGQEYPFYFTSHEEAVQKANNIDLVQQTHNYLKNHPIQKKLTGDYFLNSFKKSGIFKNL